VLDRFASRLSYVQGDFGDAATYDRVGAVIKAATRPVFYLKIPLFLFSTVIKRLADAGLTESGRVVLEKPFGHDRASARALTEELHQCVDESQLYRINHYLGKIAWRRSYTCASPQDLGAGLEQHPPRKRPDHAGGRLRRPRSRALLRPRRRAP
jgi:hypothetical protein